jgi:hypothetical protein
MGVSVGPLGEGSTAKIVIKLTGPLNVEDAVQFSKEINAVLARYRHRRGGLTVQQDPAPPPETGS